MARTRLQAGVLEKKKYNPKAITLQAESGKGGEHLAKRLPIQVRKEGYKPNKVAKRSQGTTGLGTERVTDRGRRRSTERTHGKPTSLGVLGNESTPSQNAVLDTSDGNHFWPSVVFGEQEEEGTTPWQRADRAVQKWVTILKEHEENLPEAVPHVRKQLRIAQSVRNALRYGRQALGNNQQQPIEEAENERVIERIHALEDALANSTNEYERTNISGAIEAYKSAKIGYDKHYTLIWAGKVVDMADTYADFAFDRDERLDRYAKEHGPHWLWWESPLNVHPESQARAMRCAVVERVPSATGFGHYFVSQGFWKREGTVTRVPQAGQAAHMQPIIAGSGRATSGSGPIYCGGVGPRLLFRSLLDSGATYPSLYASDFRSLGVFPDLYPAQALCEVMTSNGIISQKVYELHVELTTDQGQSLVDPADPVNPAYPKYIGGISPVGLIAADDSPPIHNGLEQSSRLSGIMPFLAAYISSTPSKNVLLFGENRNDVLGAHKMPPVRRWMVGLSQDPSDRSHWPRFQDPMIKFSHRRGLIVDEDIGPAASKLSVNVGTATERSETFDPRGDHQKRKAAGLNVGTIDPSA